MSRTAADSEEADADAQTIISSTDAVQKATARVLSTPRGRTHPALGELPAPAPFIKYAGGKRKSADAIIARMPHDGRRWRRYLEPFVGGGALFFSLAARGWLIDVPVTLADKNADLIALWTAVRDKPAELIRNTQRLLAKAAAANAAHDPAAGRLESAETVYVAERALWNQGRHRPERQLFLRRLAWCGLWRENKAGHFNAPYRGALPDAGVDPKRIWAAHHALRPTGSPSAAVVDLQACDFSDWQAERGDVIYLDPPYVSQQKSGAGFTGYTKTGWSILDLTVLIQRAAAWAERGASVYLSHADAADVRKLVHEFWPSAQIDDLLAPRAINVDPTKRGLVRELLVWQAPRSR